MKIIGRSYFIGLPDFVCKLATEVAAMRGFYILDRKHRRAALTLDSAFREAFILDSSQKTRKEVETVEQLNQNQRCIK